MAKAKLWITIGGAVALLLVGFVFLKLPTPEVVVSPETIIEVGPLKVTNTIITTWLVVATLVVLGWAATRRMSLVPSGLQNFVEASLEWFLGLCENIAGQKNGRRFFIPCCTIFLFVVTSNWMGLLPFYNQIGKTETVQEKVEHFVHGQAEDAKLEAKKITGVVFAGSGPHFIPVNPAGQDEIKVELPAGLTPHEFEQRFEQEYEKQLEDAGAEGGESGIILPFFRSANTDLNMTLALAIMSAIFVESWGLSTLGFRYIGKFFAFGALKKGPMGVIDVFVGILEFIAEAARLISFTFRLFGNIFAGEVLLFVMSFIMPLVIIIPFYGLELFVGLIQALVFSLLTLVFGVIAVSHPGDEGHGEEGAHAEHHG